MLGAPFSCKTGHSFASAGRSRNDGALQCFARAADPYLLILDDNLIDKQPHIGLAKSGVIAPQSIAKPS